MSYCRWSSNDFACDLYCYEDVSGGYTTHVAGNRIVGDIPKTPPLTKDSVEEYAKAYDLQRKFLDACEHKPIGLPHDGKSFNDPDLESFLVRLIELKAVGYNVPDRAVESVREEIAEEAKHPITIPQ